MLNNSQKHAGMEPTHARKMSQNLKHTRLDCKDYTISGKSMHGVSKTAQNIVMAGLESHKNEP